MQRYLIKNDRAEEWSKPKSKRAIRRRVRNWLDNADTGDALKIKAVDPYPPAELPTGAEGFWKPAICDIYSYVFAKGRYPGVAFWGVFNCRHIGSDPNAPWSKHAWAAAIDIHPKDKAQGDRIKADLLKEFGDVLAYIQWWVTDHYDHLHVEIKGTYEGTPPCAT